MSELVSEARLENLRDRLSLQSDPVSRDASLALDELLQRRASDRPDDNEPITAEWWRDVFGVDVIVKCIWPYCLVRESDDSVLLAQLGDDKNATTCKLPHIRTRGDLRRLWVALTGKELGS